MELNFISISSSIDRETRQAVLPQQQHFGKKSITADGLRSSTIVKIAQQRFHFMADFEHSLPGLARLPKRQRSPACSAL
jgi:hypothetical protein